jgi:phage tail sheath protein FI
MATFSRPGVYIQEVALPQAVTPANTATAVAAFMGALPQGSTNNPVYVATWNDFVSNFGGLNDSYPTTWAAYNFFTNGGRGLYVKRVVGSGSASAGVTITDGVSGTTTATVTAASATGGVVTYTANNTFTAGQTITITGLSTSAFNLTSVVIATATATQFTVANSASGTAVTGASATATVSYTASNVFTLTAVNPGTWANNYAAQIVGAGTSSRFGLNIYATTTINGVTSSTLVESYSDLSMSSSDANYVGSVLPTQSKLVAISAINAAKTPAVQTTPSALTGGIDGAAPSRTDYGTAWLSFDSVTASLVLYAADAPYAATSTLTSQIHGDAILYASNRTDCFVVIDTPSGLVNAAAAQTSVTATMAIASGATSGNIVAAYWPWINIPDATKLPGATRLQAPGAAVVGQYLATDATRGPAKTPAGLNNKIALAVSTEHSFTNAELDSLNTSSDPINTIRQVPGAGIVIMGGRTLDNTPNNRYINLRRSLIFIEKTLSDLTQFAIFENNDSRLWNQINTVLNSFLFNYWNGGGLRGTTASQAYFVKCDGTNNTFADIQNGKVNIEVGVALQYPAEFVVIKLGQLTGNASA